MTRLQQHKRDLIAGMTFQSSTVPSLFDPVNGGYLAPPNPQAWDAAKAGQTRFNMGGSVKGKPGVSLAALMFPAKR